MTVHAGRRGPDTGREQKAWMSLAKRLLIGVHFTTAWVGGWVGGGGVRVEWEGAILPCLLCNRIIYYKIQTNHRRAQVITAVQVQPTLTVTRARVQLPIIKSGQKWTAARFRMSSLRHLWKFGSKICSSKSAQWQLQIRENGEKYRPVQFFTVSLMKISGKQYKFIGLADNKNPLLPVTEIRLGCGQAAISRSQPASDMSRRAW